MYVSPYFFRKVNIMKKSKIVALTSAVSLTAAAVFAATSMASAAPALGDVDQNGKVAAKDARMILRHAAKIEVLDDSVISVADVNGDDKVNATDARLVLRYASKLISVMGGEEKYDKLINSEDSSVETEITTKKTDSSELSTRPVTKPTSKYTTVPSSDSTTDTSSEATTEVSTSSTSEVTTEATTEVTTEATTSESTTVEKTTAETTTTETTTTETTTTTEPTTAEPTTAEPTTAEPTTAEPTTAEPTTVSPDNTNEIPAAIRSFASGKYDFTGSMLTSAGKQNVRFTVDGKNLRVSMAVDDVNLDFMRLIEKNKLTKKDESKFYIVSVDNNSYIEFNKYLMSLAGIDESELDLPEMSVDLSNAECTTSLTTFCEKEDVMCYTFKSENSLVKVYMDGEQLLGMETCDEGGNILTAMIFDSFSGDIPEGRLSIDGYKKMSISDFIGLFS